MQSYTVLRVDLRYTERDGGVQHHTKRSVFGSGKNGGLSVWNITAGLLRILFPSNNVKLIFFK